MLERPLFRHDLVSQPIDEQGQRFVDVSDPKTGNTFRFYEVEYAVACAMDGERDVAGIISWAKEELGLETSKNEIQVVVATLDDLGYLARAARKAESTPAPERRAAPPVPAPPPQRPAAAPLSQEIEFGDSAADEFESPRHTNGARDYSDEPTMLDARPATMPAPPPRSSSSGPMTGDVAVDLGAHLGSQPEAEPEPSYDQLDSDSHHDLESQELGEDDAGAKPIALPEDFGSSQQIEVPKERKPGGVSSFPLGNSMVFLVVVLVLLLGLGGVMYFRQSTLAEEDDGTTALEQVVVGVDTPVLPTASLPMAILDAVPTEHVITAPHAMKVMWLASAGTAVKTGDVIAKEKGYDEAELAVVDARDKLAAAEVKGDKTAIAKWTEAVAKSQADLEKLAIVSTVSGVMAPLATAGEELAEGANLARVTTPAQPKATFVVSDGGRYVVGSKVDVSPKNDPNMKVPCTVESTDTKQVVVACPADSGVTSGVTVHLH
jgi:hypothetical protein